MQNDVERRLSGRQGQARRNDARILEAARAVFLDDPEAPISAVAARAGVGIGALYRRYASKQDLLRQLARDGLRRYLVEAEVAVADEGDAWAAFAAFMQRILDSDVLAITINLAGTFTPTDDLMADSTRAEDLNTRLVERTKAKGGLRADIEVDDLSLILEQVASLRLGNDGRTRQLRRRYLALFLAGLRSAGEPLPGPPPAAMELASRWSPEGRR
jgi:AcrR family transcriptional regulator